MNAMLIKSPKVKVSDAIKFSGNQAALAKILGISSASVCEWVANSREFVPELQAWKLTSINPSLDVSA